MHDKKIRKGQQTLILARGIGEAFLCREATEADILGMLRTYVHTGRLKPDIDAMGTVIAFGGCMGFRIDV